MRQAKRKKQAGYVPPQLPTVLYKGKPLNRTKVKWIIEHHPESLRRVEE
jgi:hypothetical protein